MTSKPTMKIIASFDIPYLQYLDKDSQPTQDFPESAQDPQQLLHLYRQMALTRMIDNKAVKLQRTGKMSTYPASLGQEAIGVALGDAMAKDDVLFPYYRETSALLQRGAAIEDVLSIWGGDERGNQFTNNTEDFTTCVPIATQCLHAAGAAFAFKHRQQPRAALTTIGEGGTSKGDFYEALNLAGAWQLPLVFVVNNNQWAISVPRDQQTQTKTIAQKAIAAGFQGIQVDGNDVIAIHYAVSESLEKARQGGGPTLIEAVTYRLCDHTTADDASRYQPSEEVKAAWKLEPIARLAHYLESQQLWSKSQETDMQQALTEQVNNAVDRYQTRPKDNPSAIFDSLYAELPDALIDQRDEVIQENT
jgi:2-oxoisovalerate dehydrogenase E1 component alpha subunit